jgi:hypothetical protein
LPENTSIKFFEIIGVKPGFTPLGAKPGDQILLSGRVIDREVMFLLQGNHALHLRLALYKQGNDLAVYGIDLATQVFKLLVHAAADFSAG